MTKFPIVAASWDFNCTSLLPDSGAHAEEEFLLLVMMVGRLFSMTAVVASLKNARIIPKGSRLIETA